MARIPKERNAKRLRSFDEGDKQKGDKSSNQEKRLLESGNFADIVVYCGTKNFNLHKFVLSSRSKFFRAALTGPFVEAQSGVITLGETDPEIFAAVVEYLYREAVPNLAILKTRVNIVGKLAQLYRAGRYFEIDGLEQDVVSCLAQTYYCSLKLSTDCKAMPVPANDRDSGWLAHLFGAIDMAFEEGIIAEDPLQKFFTNLVHRSFDWCFESKDFIKHMESRSCFATAITTDVVQHITEVGLRPLTSLGGPELDGLVCCHCQGSLAEGPAVLLGVPSAQRRLEGHRPQYLCLLCKNKRGRDKF